MQTSRSTIDAFLAQPAFALVGASRSGKKFGNTILRELRGKGMRVYPVHPLAPTIEGVRAYANFSALPEPVRAAIICVPPDSAVTCLRDAAHAGVTHVWLQQGSESPYIEQLCRELGLEVVSGRCILMFAHPSGVHRMHRALTGMLGLLPQ